MKNTTLAIVSILPFLCTSCLVVGSRRVVYVQEPCAPAVVCPAPVVVKPCPPPVVIVKKTYSPRRHY